MPFILLIRHGENDVMLKRLAGRTPGVHLNEKGQKQAAELARQLKGARLQAIYSSPLERALETAAPLAAFCNLPIQVHPGLIEMDYGAWQGRSFRQLARTNLWKTLHEKPSIVQFPGGEKLAAAMQRALDTVNEIAAAHEERAIIACFSHADVIRLVVAGLLNMSLDDYHRLTIHPASLTGVILGRGMPRLVMVNQMLELPRLDGK